MKVSGVPSAGATITVSGATVQFTANNVAYNLPVPDSVITFSSSASTSTTSFDAVHNQWNTTVPVSYSANVFLAGLSDQLSSALPGGINPVSWTATFYTDTSGVSVQWQWAAAVYTSFSANYTALGVKPIDATSGSSYPNSDHAGTPENYKSSVIGGARGGGGSNWTGSYSGTASVTPQVAANHAPVANAGPNQTVFVGTTVQLNGTASYDPDGLRITYGWSFVSIPAGSGAALSGATGPLPTFLVDKSGNYTVQLIVSDGELNSAPSQVVISTKNSPPVANAGPNQTVTAGTMVQLDGSGSSDVDGDPLTYRWTIVSAPTGSTATLSNSSIVNPTFVPNAKGTYVVQLIVNDGTVDSSPSQVTISSTNSPPVANPGPDQKINVGMTVQLDGSRSTDVDGDPLTYSWAILSTPTGSTAVLSSTTAVQPTFVADRVGTYIVQLIVNDGTVNSPPKTVTISTNDVPPVANPGPNQTVTAGTLVTLNGSSSTDSDGLPLTYQWALSTTPSGSTAVLTSTNAVSTSFTADLPGNYVAQLIVNDGYLNSLPATVTISTNDVPPVANPGPNQTVKAATTVQLDGTGSTSSLNFPLTYKWAILSQPGGGNAVLSGPTAAKPTFVPNVAGLYVVQLNVNDGYLDSQPQTMTVTATPQFQPPLVNAGPNQTIPLPNRMALQGSATSQNNPPGTVTVQWTQISGPPMSFVDSTNPTTIAVFNTAGTYVLQLTGAENNLQASSKVTITAVAGNQPPIVNAGPDQAIQLPPTSTVTLAGSAVDNDGLPPGATLTYSWSQVSGPAAATIASPTSLTTTATFTTTGFYTFRLTVSDSQLSGIADTHVKVYGPNQPPVVNAGPSQTIALPTNTVILKGSASDNGSILASLLTVRWSLVQGPGPVTFANPISPVTSAIFSQVGTYQLRLTASDTQLQASSDTFVTVNPPPPPAGGATLVLSPSAAGPNVAGTTQSLTATAKDGSGSPISGLVATFTVTGPNAATGTATTGVNGIASFSYSGSHNGTDSIQAQVTVTGVTLLSNTGTVSWITPVQTISTNAIFVQFFPNPSNSGTFNIAPGTQAVFSQYFPSINFNPPAGTVPGNNTGINENTRPVYEVTTDVNGNFTGAIEAQGNGQQAGLGSLFQFESVYTSTFTVAAAGNVTFNFYSDDGFIFGVGNGATRVSGALSNPPANMLTPFTSLPVMGSYNLVTAPVNNTITVYFPAAGNYPYEVDYTECCAGQVALTMASQQTGGHGVPPAGSTTLTPNTSQTLNIGQSVTFTAFVFDASGAGVGNAQAVFTVTGAHTKNFFATTDATGHATFSYTATTAGTDLVQAQAQFAALTTYSNQTSVVWNNVANQPPVVSAGPSQTITYPNVVTLNGTATDDGLPNGTLTVTWSMTSGPGTVTFSSPNQTMTQAAFSGPGTYVLQLSANDSQYTTSSTVTVTVNPATQPIQPPAVSAGPSQTVVFPNAATLAGSVSSNGSPAGTTLTSLWSVLGGPGTVTFGNVTQPTTSATFSAPGTYFLQLSASNAQYTSTATTTIIAITPPATQNQPPAVSAGALSPVVLPNSVSLNGSATDDGLPNGTLTVRWAMLSGPGTVTFANPANASTQATFSAAGTYVLQLSANDSQYTSSVTLAIVALNPSSSGGSGTPSQPPVVSAGNPQTLTLPTNTTTLYGLVTDNSVPASQLTIAWSEVSGPAPVSFTSLNTPKTNATFSIAGVYLLQLSANDGQYTTTAQTTVTVTTPSTSGGGGTQNQPPTVSAGSNLTIYLPSNTATLTGSASSTSSTLNVSWTEVSGPSAVTFSNPTNAVTQVTFSAAGSYVLQLSASDTQFTSTSQVAIAVVAQPAPPSGPPPTVSITTPTDATEISKPASVTGTVSNGNWVLQYAPVLENNTAAQQWTTFGSGGGAASGTLATFDPTILLNGQYAIRLSSTDSSGQQSSTSLTVNVTRNMKVGVFTLSFNDLTVPVAGVPIQVIRTYDSRDKATGDFGVGWRLSLADVHLQKSRNLGFSWLESIYYSGPYQIPTSCLDPTTQKIVTVTFPGGKIYRFQAGNNIECQNFGPITAPVLTFTELPGPANTAGATLAPADGGSVLLDGAVPGPVNLLAYDGTIYNPTVFILKTADGTSYTIDQVLGLTSVTDTNGNTLTISANGITSSAGKSVPFVRDAQNRIKQITDPVSNSLFYSYDPTTGDLVSFTDRAQNTTTYHYDGSHDLTQIITPDGKNALANAYDPATGRLAASTDEKGFSISFTHNVAAQTEIFKDRNVNSTAYFYDNDGNVIQTTDALGKISTATYDANDNKLTETNALHNTSSYSYDGSGNRLTETDPLNNAATYTYSALNKPLTITDADGHTTTNTYDTSGNLLTTKDPLGNVTTTTCLSNGLLKATSDTLKKNTSFTYDGSGNLQTQTDANGTVTSYTYDANGNRVSQSTTRTTPSGPQTLTTTYIYDGNNRPVKTINPDDAPGHPSSTQVVYNNLGQQSATVDALNHTTNYFYDADGHLTQTKYADNSTESATYDNNGNRLTSTDRAGHGTTLAYDALNRLTTTTNPDNSVVTTSYDDIGQPASTKDANGNLTQYTYDAAGRRTDILNALQQKTHFTYDAAGNQLSILDANQHSTTFTYDNANRRTRVTYADGKFESTAYDAIGRVFSRTDANGIVTQYGYDALGRLISVIQDAATGGLNLRTTYTYNEVGNRLTQTDANSHTTGYQYDQRGRRTQRALPLNQSESYAYDVNGNLSSRTDFNGRATIYAYDNLNRLLSKTADAFFATNHIGAASVSYTYTPTGQRATMSDASGSTTYTYDNRNRLVSKATPEGTLTYTYDAAGDVKSILSSNASGANLAYGYDALNRLSTVTNASGVTNYGYDNVGNLQSFAYPNGVAHSYSYDTRNRLTNLGVAKASVQLAGYSYILDAAGHRLSVMELSGRTVNYGYDNLYRLTSESIANDPNSINGAVNYTYDAVGNRKQMTSTLAPVPAGLFNYDGNDRFTAGDTYDNNGNTVSSGGIADVYDFENHLVQQAGATIVYDGDGNRVSKTTASGTTKFLVDDRNPTGYAQVLDEIQSGTVSRTYSWGLELISQTRPQPTPTPAQVNFYVYDGHGSVRALTNTTGAVTDTYDYDAFGNLIHSTGTTPNNYLFAGEQFDPDLNLYYNRARYLNVSTGRFWSMDSFEGAVADPLSLHKYLYSGNDPVNQVDRSGNDFDFASTLTATTGGVTIFGMSALQSAVIIQGVLGAALASSLTGIGAALEGQTPDQIEAATGNPYNLAIGALLGIAGSYAVAFQLGRLVLTAVALGGGGSAAYTAYKGHHIAAAVYFGVLALGGAFLVNAASLLRTPSAPPRLVVGGGSASGFPTVPEGSFSLNIEPSALPNVVGDAARLPFAGDTFGEIYYEYVPYKAFTGPNGTAIAEAAAALQSGGRLIIDTGSGVPVSELQGLLQSAGFSNIQVTSSSPTSPVRITAIKP